MKAFIDTIRKNELSYLRFMVFYIAAAAVIAICNVNIARTQGALGQASVQFEQTQVTGFLLVMAAYTGVKVIVSASLTLTSKRFAGKTGYTMRNNFAKHFTSIPYPDFSGKNSGEMLSLYTNDLPKATELITTELFTQLSQIIGTLISAVFLAMINPVLTLIYFALFPALIFLQTKISAPIGKHMQNVSDHRADFNAVVIDSLQNPSAVIAYSLEDVMERRYMESYNRYFGAYMKYVVTLLKLAIAGVVSSNLPSIVTILISGINVAAGTMEVADFIAFNVMIEVSGTWLVMLAQSLGIIQAEAAFAGKVLENTGEPAEDLGGYAPDKITGAPAIAFRDVAFGYTEEHDILNGVTFEIPAGAKAAIVGASGCGKSTVMKLLLALYEPGRGGIELFGSDIREYGKSALRDRLAYVPQDSFLFPATIRENIVGDMTYSEDRLRKACREAGILDFIESLSDGFDTVLGEFADNISGGQRQRIAIARTFYRDAPVVLLDEATSALDPATEAAVLESFYSSMEGKTALVVAHRPAAIAACDFIIVLDSGRVAETGTHGQLIANHSVYAALYEEAGERSYE